MGKRVEFHFSLIPSLGGYELVMEHKIQGEKEPTCVKMTIHGDQLFLRVQEHLNNQLRSVCNKLAKA